MSSSKKERAPTQSGAGKGGSSRPCPPRAPTQLPDKCTNNPETDTSKVLPKAVDAEMHQHAQSSAQLSADTPNITKRTRNTPSSGNPQPRRNTKIENTTSTVETHMETEHLPQAIPPATDSHSSETNTPKQKRNRGTPTSNNPQPRKIQSKDEPPKTTRMLDAKTLIDNTRLPSVERHKTDEQVHDELMNLLELTPDEPVRPSSPHPTQTNQENVTQTNLSPDTSLTNTETHTNREQDNRSESAPIQSTTTSNLPTHMEQVTPDQRKRDRNTPASNNPQVRKTTKGRNPPKPTQVLDVLSLMDNTRLPSTEQHKTDEESHEELMNLLDMNTNEPERPPSPHPTHTNEENATQSNIPEDTPFTNLQMAQDSPSIQNTPNPTTFTPRTAHTEQTTPTQHKRNRDTPTSGNIQPRQVKITSPKTRKLTQASDILTLIDQSNLPKLDDHDLNKDPTGITPTKQTYAQIARKAKKMNTPPPYPGKWHKQTRQRPPITREHPSPGQLKIGSFNALSLSKDRQLTMDKLQSLARHMDRHKLSALSIQEHRHLNETAQIDEAFAQKYVLITANAETTNAGSTHGGVAWLLEPTLYSNITNITVVSPRILSITIIQNKSKIHLISVYAPQSALPQAEHQEFYTTLEAYLETISTNVIIAGDFNAALRVGDNGPHGHPIMANLPAMSSKATDRLKLFLATNALKSVMGNNNPTDMTTYISPDKKRKVALDHIIIHDTGKIRINKAYTATPPTPSDHLPLIAITDMPTKHNKPKPRQPRKDYRVLTQKDTDGNLPEAANQFIALVKRPAKNHEQLIQNLTEAQDSLPERTRPQLTNKSKDPKYAKAINKYNSLNKHTDLGSLKQQYALITNRGHEITNEDIQRMCNIFESEVNKDGKRAYEAIANLKTKVHKPGLIKAESPAARLQVIRKHCQTQLTAANQKTVAIDYPPIKDQPQYKTGPFSQEEIAQAAAKMPRGKTPGVDAITTDTLKVPEVQTAITETLNKALKEAKLPQQLKTTKFIMIPKSAGNLKDPKSWRYIALLSVITKLYNKMLLKRLQTVIEQYLRSEQNAYRPKRNTLQHIAALRLVIDANNKTKKDTLTLVFVDFRNAFPSITREAIIKALKRFKVPQGLISAIMAVYNDHTAYVSTQEGNTDTFSPDTGVLQGDTLAPYLFILVLDAIMAKAIDRKNGLVTSTGETITDLTYADDIVLIAPTNEQAAKQLQSLESEAKKAGLIINTTKTKYVNFGPQQTSKVKTLDNTELEKVEEYKYLGAHLNVEKDIKYRTMLALEATSKLRKVWKNDKINNTHKVNLFRALIMPVLMYGTPTYPLNAVRQNMLNGATTRLIRKVQNVHPLAHMTLADLYGTKHNSDPLQFLYTEQSTKQQSSQKEEQVFQDIPQASTLAHVRQLTMLQETILKVPTHPLVYLLDHQPPKPHKSGIRTNLKDSVLQHCQIQNWQEFKQLGTDAQKWQKFVYDTAMKIENETYERATHRKTLHHDRDNIKKLQAEYGPKLPAGTDDTPLSEWPLQQLIRAKTTKRKRAILDTHFPDLDKQTQENKMLQTAKENETQAKAQCPPITIYTDGSVHQDKTAGYGIFYGPNHPRNTATNLPKDTTINICELQAVLTSIRQNIDKNIIINSDSSYVTEGKIRISNKYIRRRLRKSIRWRELLHLIKIRDKLQLTTEINKVKAHDGIPGNEAADILANAGANNAWAHNPEVRRNIQLWYPTT